MVRMALCIDRLSVAPLSSDSSRVVMAPSGRRFELRRSNSGVNSTSMSKGKSGCCGRAREVEPMFCELDTPTGNQVEHGH